MRLLHSAAEALVLDRVVALWNSLDRAMRAGDHETACILFPMLAHLLFRGPVSQAGHDLLSDYGVTVAFETSTRAHRVAKGETSLVYPAAKDASPGYTFSHEEFFRLPALSAGELSYSIMETLLACLDHGIARLRATDARISAAFGLLQGYSRAETDRFVYELALVVMPRVRPLLEAIAQAGAYVPEPGREPRPVRHGDRDMLAFDASCLVMPLDFSLAEGGVRIRLDMRPREHDTVLVSLGHALSPAGSFTLLRSGSQFAVRSRGATQRGPAPGGETLHLDLHVMRRGVSLYANGESVLHLDQKAALPDKGTIVFGSDILREERSSFLTSYLAVDLVDAAGLAETVRCFGPRRLDLRDQYLHFGRRRCRNGFMGPQTEDEPAA